MQVYGLSGPMAAVLAGGGVVQCGNGFKVDLGALAAHNKIEHDASMVGLTSPAYSSNANICQGAPRY